MGIGPEETELLTRMMVVVERRARVDVNRFVLKGPITDAPIDFATFLGLFPHLKGMKTEFAVVNLNPAVGIPAIYKNVLELGVPKSIEDLAIQEDRPLRTSLVGQFAYQDLPMLMVAFGRIKDTQEEVAILFAVLGYTPRQALTGIQEEVRQQQISLN